MECANEAIIKKAVKLAIQKKLSFYAYSLPGTTKIQMGVALEHKLSNNYDGRTSGFIIVPYKTGNNKPLFIKNELTIHSEKELHKLSDTPSGYEKTEPQPNNITTIEEYRKGADYLLQKIKCGEIKKAVYSRTVQYKSRAMDSAPDWFATINRTYPSAFCFIISVPGETTWMGATPELFLEYRNEEVRTMALAATKLNTEARNWSKKEEEEQHLVTEYIKEQFIKAGIEPEILPREEYPAGAITHLCNKISAKKIPPAKAAELLKMLHPTPAVCGVPAKKAAQIIEAAENRDRRYYSGYLGPVENSESFSLFVNLRSMELFSESAQLYAGGGYTADSDIQSEWQETEHKTKTLLSCIDKKDEYYNR